MILRPAVPSLTIALFVSCVDATPRRGTPDILPDAVADALGDTVADIRPDTEVEPECVEDEDCPLAESTCIQRVCVGGTCTYPHAAANAPCDDGNPCTADGKCAGTNCKPGEQLADETSCDDGQFCNGVHLCNKGTCEPAPAIACATSNNPCIKEVICSEAHAGACIEVPRDNGTLCLGPETAPDSALWNCSQGECVPPRMVHIPPGRFTLGCDGPGCSTDNTPTHKVDLSGFIIEAHETTEREFQACRRDARFVGIKCKDRIGEALGQFAAAPDEPVRQLDWFNAETLCRYKGRRLCTEAEWERAARGTDPQRLYPWGGQVPDCTRATFSSGGAGCGLGGPSPIGIKPTGQTVEGVMDLAGNVHEWVADYYGSDVYATRPPVSQDPIQSTPVGGIQARVFRGGGYRSAALGLRSHLRSSLAPDASDIDLGVRCCADWGPR
jgi:formylglycine-generating enzyme required for sulfatase activity